jgi:hypothetical protein
MVNNKLERIWKEVVMAQHNIPQRFSQENKEKPQKPQEVKVVCRAISELKRAAEMKKVC